MARLTGKIAIVTRADSEIGRGIAQGLGAAGAEVVALADEPDWTTLLERVSVDHGGVDILVNGPGAFRAIPLDETTADDFDALFAEHVERAYLAIQQVMPLMAERGGGSIINVGSRLGIRGQADCTAYCASQGALTQLTLAAALDGADRKIRVNVAHAGTLDGAEAPLGPTAAGDLVGAVVYLASDESRLVTGSEITIDGGVNAS